MLRLYCTCCTNGTPNIDIQETRQFPARRSNYSCSPAGELHVVVSCESGSRFLEVEESVIGAIASCRTRLSRPVLCNCAGSNT